MHRLKLHCVAALRWQWYAVQCVRLSYCVCHRCVHPWRKGPSFHPPAVCSGLWNCAPWNPYGSSPAGRLWVSYSCSLVSYLQKKKKEEEDKVQEEEQKGNFKRFKKKGKRGRKSNIWNYREKWKRKKRCTHKTTPSNIQWFECVSYEWQPKACICMGRKMMETQRGGFTYG